jgi:PhzF family phenazine biosynthesis protein
MKLRIYQVDAFTEEIFKGNPAAVVPLKSWLPDELMQKIAAENNLSETAFVVADGEYYLIRWFTPTVEVDLCGHATLATAHALFEHEGYSGDLIKFISPRTGALDVRKEELGMLTLDFPVDEIKRIDLDSSIFHGFRKAPKELWRGKSDYVLLYESEDDIRDIHVDFKEIEKVKTRGFIVTAQGKEVDFVSRWFGPQVGVEEDPVTGSAHTTLTALWAAKLNKNSLTAIQMSARSGSLICKLVGDRVHISGNAVTYLQGEIFI